MYRRNPLHSFHERLTDLEAGRKRRTWLRHQIDGAAAAEAQVHERIDAARARLERDHPGRARDQVGRVRAAVEAAVAQLEAVSVKHGALA